jgi:hypothetical protein
MKQNSRPWLNAALSPLLLVVAPWFAAAGTIQIDTPTLPMATIGFDSMPLGPTSLSEINATYPSSTLSAIDISTQMRISTYEFKTQGGLALAPIDIDGTPGIVAPGDTYFRPNSITLGLTEPSNEFGFEIGDFVISVNKRFRVELFDGATSLGSIPIVSDKGNAPVFVATNDGSSFTSVQLGPIDNFPLGSWVVSSLYLQTVPEPRTGLLTVFNLLSLCAIRSQLSLIRS